MTGPGLPTRLRILAPAVLVMAASLISPAAVSAATPTPIQVYGAWH